MWQGTANHQTSPNALSTAAGRAPSETQSFDEAKTKASRRLDLLLAVDFVIAYEVLMSLRVDLQRESNALLVIDQVDGFTCFLTFWAVAS